MEQILVSQPQVYDTPYPQFLLDEVFDPDSADHLLDWFSNSLEWHLNQGQFFEQYESNLLATPIPENCRDIFSSASISRFRGMMEQYLGARLMETVAITAHKLVPGQGIGIHNDEPHNGLETHRLVVQLNPAFEDSHGGHLLVLASSSPNDIVRIVRPMHNTGFGFAMSDRSFHAVSEVRQGERYTIVFSFWDDRYQQQDPGQGAAEPAVAGDATALLRQRIQFLIDAGAGDTHHSNENLLNHLANTYAVLKKWSCSEDLCNAGLFHSIYGTSAFQVQTVALEERGRVRQLIGSEAEQIAYLYCILDRKSLYRNIHGDTPYFITSQVNGKPLVISESQFADLLTLDLANSIEQLPRIQIDPELVESEKMVYISAQRFFPAPAWQQFLSAYDIKA